MAERPVFIPKSTGKTLVAEVPIEFKWHPGMSRSQKIRNVHELHDNSKRKGLKQVLEVSTASENDLGLRLSAINLTIGFGRTEYIFESAYQGSKVFARGGPYEDIYLLDGRSAKRDERIKSSGRIVGFKFRGDEYPNNPPTAFYDWLYMNAIYSKNDILEHISEFDGFTDISFNPEKSLNCQARSCALTSSLVQRGKLDDAVESFGEFLSIIDAYGYDRRHSSDLTALTASR
jgi:hypothetical protein